MTRATLKQIDQMRDRLERACIDDPLRVAEAIADAMAWLRVAKALPNSCVENAIKQLEKI
jgi:hypothetical protein